MKNKVITDLQNCNISTKDLNEFQIIRVMWWNTFYPKKYSHLLFCLKAGMSWRYAYEYAKELKP